MDQKMSSGQISNFEIKQELDDTEFDVEDLHHSIDIKEESHFLEPEQIKCECYLCGIQFCDKSQLIKHLDTQCLEKPFSCEICAFRCLTKLQLNRHTKTHIDLIVTDEESHRTGKPLDFFLKTDVYADDVDDEDSADKKLKNLGEQWTSSELLRDHAENTSNLPPNPITQSGKKANTRERPTICPICRKDVVSHFTRHLLRHHKNNKEVILMRTLKPGSKERLSLVTALRKQGYFYLKTERNILNPIRTAKDPKADYFVCTYCLGHYKKYCLYRHVKICKSKPPDLLKTDRNCLAAAQTYMATVISKNHQFLTSSRIKKEVFCIMRPDDVSSVAKSDPLICLYGEALLNKPKTQHSPIAVSNKIREMARLLIASKTLNGEIRGLFDVLKPEMFGLLISATRAISGYDEKTNRFKAASLALHLCGNLKMVCEVALNVVIEEKNIPNIEWSDGEQKKTEINDLKNLIVEHWCSEVSACAPSMHNEKYIQDRHSPIAEFQCEEVDETDRHQPMGIKNLNTKKKKNGRVRWSDVESKVVTSHFRSHIEKKIAPRKLECEALLAQHINIFVNKNWVKIKTFVYNTYRDK